MRRIFALTVIASLAGTPVAFAGESLVQSASRAAQELARAERAPATATAQPVLSSQSTLWVSRAPAPSAAAQGAQVLSKSGLSKRTKALLFIGLGVGFAASVWTIDHHVQDITPSSLGTRQD